MPVLAVVMALIATPAAATERSSATGGARATTSISKKAWVKKIQRVLGVRADGIMGPQTRRAVRRFQRANGLRVTGRVDASTIVALGLRNSNARTLSNADPATILQLIAQCESGGDPTAVSRDGRYRGKYQFSRATWKSLGGEGDPAKADESTQDAMALKLYQLRGTAPWPSCAKKIDA
ncbi:MAG TPA: transglycosylase family protein [Solirubrobacter sp.]|nr:transglycosylase family protein [Solirubrobacter sp.]